MHFIGEVIFYINGQQSGDRQIVQPGYEDVLDTVFPSAGFGTNNCFDSSYAALETYDVALLPEQVKTRYEWETSYRGDGCL